MSLNLQPVEGLRRFRSRLSVLRKLAIAYVQHMNKAASYKYWDNYASWSYSNSSLFFHYMEEIEVLGQIDIKGEKIAGSLRTWNILVDSVKSRMEGQL